jgi:superfamily I DNA/RNA helicase
MDADESPRILFTTYTNALVAYCKQQLQHLLGSDADHVSVRTADSIVREVLTGAQEECRPSHETVKRRALSNALASVRAARTYLHSDLTDPVARLSHDYLLEEFDAIIEAREISSLEDYLAAPRAGRVVGLRPDQRRLIWTTYELFCQELKRLRLSTWPQLRRRAAEIVRSDKSIERYDAVIIDEAQDLDPTVLRLLAAFCKTPRRIFIAADANQSIYGSSFRWSDVHEDLKVRGRTATITINHRSTCEIGDAAHSYLQRGALEAIDAGHSYSRHGSRPVVYTARDVEEEADALAAYIGRAAKANRVGLGSCAVLVPSHASGQSIAIRLRNRKVPAQFMTSKELDLDQPMVKVLPLKTSKGLEFPVVAIAGYAENLIRSDLRLSEEREEHLGSSRRTIFVAMTRAMRDLFVVVPATNLPPELEGFDETFWQVSHSR